MKRISIGVLNTLINSAIKKQQDYLRFADDKFNPQIVEIKLMTDGKLEVLEAIKLALQGDDIELRIIAGEYQC